MASSKLMPGARGRGALIAGVVAVFVLAGCGNSNATTASTSKNGNQLSQSHITTDYTQGLGVSAVEWLAQKKGYFTSNGLNATDTVINTSAADMVAALLGGSLDVACGVGPYATLNAVSQGASIKTIYSMGTGTTNQLVINKQVALAKHIPVDGTAQQQIAALKGSGLKLVFSNATSDQYTGFVSAMKKLGITTGQGSGVDIQTSFAGSFANIAAAYESGQVDGFGSAPPNTYLVPLNNVLRIPYTSLPGLKAASYAYCITTAAFAKAHADTLTAFSKAMVQARQFIITQQAAAQSALLPFWAEANLTDPAITTLSFLDTVGLLQSSPTPAIPKTTYDATLTLVNSERDAVSPPLPAVTTSYASFVDNTFVNSAVSALHLGT
jgi:ABC-type nitrate/sulfonate/bicarbonate transport system substrate-binding protein